MTQKIALIFFCSTMQQVYFCVVFVEKIKGLKQQTIISVYGVLETNFVEIFNTMIEKKKEKSM